MCSRRTLTTQTPSFLQPRPRPSYNPDPILLERPRWAPCLPTFNFQLQSLLHSFRVGTRSLGTRQPVPIPPPPPPGDHWSVADKAPTLSWIFLLPSVHHRLNKVQRSPETARPQSPDSSTSERFLASGGFL